MALSAAPAPWFRSPIAYGFLAATGAVALHVAFPEIWKNLMGMGSYMPHSHCYLEDPRMIWLHVVSDLLIGVSYLSISLTLIYMVKRINVPFHWIFIAFGVFILACGTTHFMEVLTIWQPRYWLAGGIKAITAGASLITAVALFPIFPKVLGLIRSAEDAREQKVLLEQEVLERSAAEAKFKGLLESAPDAILITDDCARIVLVNSQTESIFGYQRSELLNKSVELLLPDRFRANHPKPDTQFFAKPTEQFMGVALELAGRHKTGTEFPVEISLSPLVTKDGRFVMSAVRDITERKRAEKAILDAKASLQSANQLLEASLHEKECLLREIHHRVKNNLQIISGLLSLQAATLQDEKIKAIFRESDNRVKSMGLIHEMLYQDTNLATCDFAVYTRRLIDYLRETHGRDAMSVDISIEMPDIRLVIDDAIPCGLILNELISNALKYAFPNGRKGSLRIALQHESERFYTLRVSDDGVGMKPEFDIKKSNSLGLKLVNSLSKQLRGSFEREKTDVGCSFLVRTKLQL